MPEHVIVSGIITETIGKLESSALKEIKWISMVKHELKAINETLIAINRVLVNAQEQQSTNMAIRKWLQDLKSIAVDIEDEIDLILTQHAMSLKVKENGMMTLYQRFPGSRTARKLNLLYQRLRVVDQGRKQFNLQEQQPTIHSLWNLTCYLAKGLREKESLDDFERKARLRLDDYLYQSGKALTLEEYERMGSPLFPLNEYELYRIQNCRVGENRRR